MTIQIAQWLIQFHVDLFIRAYIRLLILLILSLVCSIPYVLLAWAVYSTDTTVEVILVDLDNDQVVEYACEEVPTTVEELVKEITSD